MPDYDKYLSPFSWRYASEDMRRLWSEKHKRLLWRRVWLVLAETQANYNLVSREQVSDLRTHVDQVDIPRALEIEAQIQHDLMAELKVFAEQSPVGGVILHLGATSADIQENTDAIRIRESLDLIIQKLSHLISLLCQEILKHADLTLIAFTHLQPAEPSTLGYRLAQYTQDLFLDWKALKQVREAVRGKGFKGAVGSGASFADLLGLEHVAEFEKSAMSSLDLDYFPVTNQIYPRKQEYQVLSALAGLACSVHKFAFDLRLLQSPLIGELSEPFGAQQVGSSAMPFKQNPIQAEKINSLARYLAQLPRLAWDNAAFSLLERTLDDSANRRTLLPEAFLVSDELVEVATRIVSGLRVDLMALNHNLATFGSFAATERVLIALAKAGANRQEMHERLREHALRAWDAIQNGEANPLVGLVFQDTMFNKYLSPKDMQKLLEIRNYVGDAPERARHLAFSIQKHLHTEL